MFIHASRTLKLPLLQREQVWQGLKGVLCHGCGGWGFGMFRGCGDPCSPLWTQNFSAFRSRVTHESQGCSLAVSEWKKSEKWREGKDFMRSVMKVDGWCSEILWRLLSKKLPTLTCGINRINCQTFIYPTIGRSRLLKGLLTSCWTCLTVGYLQLCLLSRLKCEAASIFLPKEVSPSSTTQTEILCQVSLPLPALPLEGKSTLATLHASCHIRHGRCHAGHGIHSTHWSRIHRSLSKAFGSSFRCHGSSFALTFSRTSGAEKLSTFETKKDWKWWSLLLDKSPQEI